MQISDLNKIINLFLVGSLAITIFAFQWIDEIQAYYKTKQLAGIEGQFPASLVILITTLLVLAVTMFIGCVIDGLTEVFFRQHLKRLTGRNLLLKLFSGKKQYEATELCRAKFNALLSSNSKYGCINHQDEREDEIFAAALFFHTAKPEHTSWLIQHHAVHVLATDYIVLILIFTVIFPALHFLGLGVKVLSIHWWSLFILSLYPLCYLSIDRRLYTYEVAYRNAILVLCEDSSKSGGGQVTA